ncbi:MAG TPA: PIN domain-containing protein [Thermoanaerobaculia bacterium]|nr:PIN domain-containing protein [Thermoanaerobaculia bacterium]
MASLIYLDTHVAAWMFAGRIDLLPAGVQASVEEHDLLISPAVVLELQYLFEIQRTAEPARMVVEALRREVGLKICDLPFSQVTEIALDQSWTRDPFDRLIVSQAILREAPLLTRDRAIRDNCSLARWGVGTD